MNNDSIIFFKLLSSSRLKSYSSLKVLLFYINTKQLKFISSRALKILARLKFKKINASFFIYSIKTASFSLLTR